MSLGFLLFDAVRIGVIQSTEDLQWIVLEYTEYAVFAKVVGRKMCDYLC